MTKTINLDGLTSVKIKQSAYDMARFCWIKNLSEADVFASCVNAECTENADEVRRIPSGEFGMLDTESYETLYLNGSGTVEIVTSALLVCPFDRGGKGGGSGGMTVDTLLDITVTRTYTSSNKDLSSCSPAQNSIITLSGNIDDYKFIYATNTYNSKYYINDYSTSAGTGKTIYCLPRIFDTSVFTWDCIAQNNIATLYAATKVNIISANEVQIEYFPNSIDTDNLIERVIILGIK